MFTPKSTMPKAKPTQSVQTYFQNLDHPLLPLIQALRETVLAAAPQWVAEQIKWNSPSFYYTGPLREEDPKKYPRDIVVFNLNKKDYVLLVFPTGVKIEDTRGLLEGNYPDGRKMVKFSTLEAAENAAADLQAVVKSWLSGVDR